MRFHARRRPGLGEEEALEEEGEIKLSDVDISHIPAQMREYRVECTQARVTLSSAKPLLYMFCAKLPADRSVSFCLPAQMTTIILLLLLLFVQMSVCPLDKKLSKHHTLKNAQQLLLSHLTSWCMTTS